MYRDEFEDESKIINIFQDIWAMYPEPAMLINRGKRIMALNWSCRQAGASLSSFCHAISGCRDAHNCCQLNQCLDERQAICQKVEDIKKQWYIYWVPLEDYPDYCVHFFAGSKA